MRLQLSPSPSSSARTKGGASLPSATRLVLPEQRHPYIRLRVQPPGRVPFDPSNPCIFSPETLAVVDDAAAGRNLSGPYRTAKEAMVAFDED